MADERKPHKTYPGRDTRGRFLPGPAWQTLPESTKGPHYGWHYKRDRVRRCWHCGRLFGGVRLQQRYCSKACKSRAERQRNRERYGTSAPARTRRRLATLTKAAYDLLPIRKRSYDKGAYWWEQPDPGLGVLIPVTDDLEDALARFVQQRPEDYDRALGGSHGPPALFHRGEALPTRGYERLLHDALLLGLTGLLRQVARGDTEPFKSSNYHEKEAV